MMTRTRRTLSAVMFTDVVGYSALVHADEGRALRLLETHRRQLRRTARRYGGRVVDSAGDGNLLVFGSALRAVECAVALQRSRPAAGDAALRLRIGVHQGDVEHARGRVFGDGVNVGARLEPLAPPGGIAVSDAVFAQVHGGLRGAFRALGPQALKNIAQPVGVHVLDEAAVQAAAAHIGAGAPDRRWLWAGVAALVLGGFATLGWRMLAQPAPAAGLAVLPLENLSGAEGSAFVEGLHDSLLTEISRTPRLRVISRTSVRRYAHERASIPEIGRTLGVSHILEGSVQRAGARVRVNVQLILAERDEHAWASTFDRDVADLFELQTEIAREVARKVSGNLLLTTLPRRERPTHSVEAYDLYLRAIAHEADPALGVQAPDEPLRLLEHAVALDPEFALAQAARARFAAWGAQWAGHADPVRVAAYVAQIKDAGERAHALNPDAAESQLALGLARYWSGEEDAAAGLLQSAVARHPNFPFALYLLSGMLERRGELEQSIDAAQRLLDIDPGNEKAYEQLTLLLQRTRRYEDAQGVCARWRRMTRVPHHVELTAARLGFYRDGDLAPWRDAIASALQSGTAELRLLVDFDRWYIAMYEGRYSAAAELGRAQADRFVRDRGTDFLWALAVGEALAAAGQRQDARPYLEAVAALFETLARQTPSEPSHFRLLSEAQAWLGRADEARANAQRAVALSAPKATREPSGTHYEYLNNEAQVAALTGRTDDALSRLEWLLARPSNVHAPAVQRDPAWAALRNEQRFRALVARPVLQP
jgi:adenylate cyclase